MNRRFGFFGIVAALILLAGCNSSVKEYGSVSLDASAIARHIVQVNADYASEQEGQFPSGDEDFDLTDEETQQLVTLLMTEVYLDIKLDALDTAGKVQKTEGQKITYQQMMMNFTKTDADNNLYGDELKAEIKGLAVGSTVDLAATVAMVCTDKYKNGVKQIYEKAFKRYYGVDEEGKLSEKDQAMLDYVIQMIMVSTGANQKFEGKTDKPITIAAGKNYATIVMQQTDGFTAGGGFTIELEDSEPLEIMVENRYEDDEIIITPVDSLYKFVRVEYKCTPNTNDSDASFDLVNNSDNVGENSVYKISISEEEILLTSNNPGDHISDFFTGKNSLFIIAQNTLTGKYKTVVYKGL